jgi:hypothetical protein
MAALEALNIITYGKIDLNRAVGIHTNNLECKGLTYLGYLGTSTYCTLLTPRSRAAEKLLKKLLTLN